MCNSILHSPHIFLLLRYRVNGEEKTKLKVNEEEHDKFIHFENINTLNNATKKAK